jgi:hypothetical protein
MADIEDIIRGATGRHIEAEGRSIICFAVRCEAPGCTCELLIPRPHIRVSKRDRAGKEPVYIHALEAGMERAGWIFRRQRARPLCPEHHPRLTYSPKPEAPKEPALPVVDPTRNVPKGPLPTGAEALPKPSRADNQRVNDALDAAYDQRAGRYKGDGSDQKLADRLALPRQLVTTLRLALFGDHDRNEAAEDDKTIAAAMELLAEADKRVIIALTAAATAKREAEEAQASVSRARAMIDGVRRSR